MILQFSFKRDINDIKLYNGPGTLSKVISNYRDTFKSSSFQCFFLQILSTAKLTVNDHYFNYFTIQLNYNKKLHASDITSITLPGLPCMVKISTSKYSHINITVNNMVMLKGDKSTRCKLGGLAFTENENEAFKETAVMCQKSLSFC